MQYAALSGLHFETSGHFAMKTSYKPCFSDGTPDALQAMKVVSQGEHQMKVNTNHVLHHNYAIWVMGRRPGWFKPQRYMYRCLRCKWAFMVNDEHRGSLRVAGDQDLSLEETRRRLASFVEGPCPGYETERAAVAQSYPGNVIAMRRENRPAKTARDARAI